MAAMEKAKQVLKQYYGYDHFRRGQEAIISRIMDGKDTLGMMPTGGGKSVCYQVPAMLLSGVTLVISPLISLMKDQVDTLSGMGIPATYVNSSLDPTEINERLAAASKGAYKLIYLAPERLEFPPFLHLLENINVSLIAVDEAHCISQWGHDFRPSYRLIEKLISQFKPKPVTLALTATATPQVKKDICQLLMIPEENTVATGFARENLHFQVVKGQDRDAFVLDYILKNKNQSGIIYTATRKEAERIYHFLVKNGIRTGKYHAGMKEAERGSFQDRFLYDDVSVMVATSAFGMGIDKSNVRFVIHYHMPKNMEAYYQEAGRAGRDGEESDCILLFAPQDIHTQTFLIEQSANEDRKLGEYAKLRKMIDYCHTEGCFQQFILHYFGEKEAQPCGKCGNCLDTRAKTDVTKEAQMVFSCVKRMQERFGKTMIAKVLAGSNDQKIRQFGFDKLSTFGIMKDKTQKEVAELIDFLTADGFLRAKDGTYPVLMLTKKAVEVLLSKKQVFRKESVRAQQIATDNLLFEKLRTLRKEIADREKIPPYIVFSDQSLREMSARMPVTREAFLQVKGVGERKAEQYAELFMHVIRTYMEEEGIQAQAQPKALPHTKKAREDGKEKSHHVTYRLLQEGKTIREIAEIRGMSERTIETHVIKCSDEGFPVEWSRFIPERYRERIADAASRAGTGRLTPIKELLPDEVSYFMIRAFLQERKHHPDQGKTVSYISGGDWHHD
ncbi:DNA helicase RecQ [Heyndrickxia coagulans]|uniref:DNA helicase RecQ n=1 Tax=Heyndrickxia coagulans TaxID=1398 RepID=UPI00031F3B0D|nr:DNA helicase RecQ [Heyndrickxia coagulans]